MVSDQSEGDYTETACYYVLDSIRRGNGYKIEEVPSISR